LFDTIEHPLTVRGQSREFGVVRLAHTWRTAAPLADAAPRSAVGTSA
jgi:hypothetical protein